MKGVHFLHATEHQTFYKLGLLFLMEMARLYGGPAMFIVTCFFAQPDCRNFVPEHCNAIIKQQLCWEGLPPQLRLLQVDAFQGKQGILQQIILSPSSKPKKTCIRPCDTNNSTQSYTKVPPSCNCKSISFIWCKNQLDTHLIPFP